MFSVNRLRPLQGSPAAWPLICASICWASCSSAAQRAADPMELAIVDSRRREVERMQRELALEREQ